MFFFLFFFSYLFPFHFLSFGWINFFKKNCKFRRIWTRSNVSMTWTVHQDYNIKMDLKRKLNAIRSRSEKRKPSNACTTQWCAVNAPYLNAAANIRNNIYAYIYICIFNVGTHNYFDQQTEHFCVYLVTYFSTFNYKFAPVHIVNNRAYLYPNWM